MLNEFNFTIACSNNRDAKPRGRIMFSVSESYVLAIEVTSNMFDIFVTAGWVYAHFLPDDDVIWFPHREKIELSRDQVSAAEVYGSLLHDECDGRIFLNIGAEALVTQTSVLGQIDTVYARTWECDGLDICIK